VVGVPDGANAEDTGTGAEDPGTPADQVNTEITREGVFGWWRSLFGVDTPYEAGGGGTGGQFMFASLEDLDTIIKRWETERDGILADRNAISEAYYSVKNPAADPLSKEQADASRDSLANMWNHSQAMLQYAENYILKLKASREQMAVMDEGHRDNFRSIQA
jgi:hypothetical protein